VTQEDVMTQDPVNILMVDDQPGKLLSYEAILSELGENLIKANSGREALEHLLKTDVAVVLMDVSMPEIDGFQLADMIRQHPRFQKTAIIFISAVHLTDLDRLKGYERGAVDYISVPVIPDLLRAKVSIFSELHRKRRQLEQLNRELEQRVEERARELQESESQFRTLANSIPQLAWMANPDGTVFWYNQRWYDYTGQTLEEAQGWGWTAVHHKDHMDRVMEGVRSCWQTGKTYDDTYPLRRHDGQYRWFLSRAVPIRDSHGAIVRWFGTSTDISEQIAAEEQIRDLNRELKQRVAELETIMRVLPVGVGISQDRNCDVIIPNAVLADMLGTKTGQNISKNPGNGDLLGFNIYKEEEPILPEQLPMQRAAATGQPINGDELELRYRDGRNAHIVVSANPLFDDEGNVRGSVGAHIDVTERKHMERMLRERAELLELASEAIIVRDRSGTVRYWNSGAEALYGWNREEALGRNINELLRATFPAPLEEIEGGIVNQGRWEGNVVHHTKEGREIIVASRQAAKLEGASGRETVLEINRDITAQYHAEEALRKTERLAAMGRVAGIIAHEINNPLEAITNTFYLLRDHPSLNEEAKYYAQLGEQELQRVTHIARQTLSFYRESQRAIPVSIPEVLDDVLELQTRQLQISGVKLEKHYSTSGLVQGFPVELKQVFLNLVGNAIQAMPEGGRLKVSVLETGDSGQNRRVKVSICDTGKGIQPEDAKRLFEPFFTTKSTKGTGLGLWISKGIVQKYEGSIRFRSIRIGEGNVTCFSVSLPALASSQKQELARYSSLSV
jgi:PAS domain S-box-containing protein